jgi:hypothetical protein
MAENNTGTVTPIVAIRNYFFADGTPVKDVLVQVKALTDEDKAELAEGAAKELGLELVAAS